MTKTYGIPTESNSGPYASSSFRFISNANDKVQQLFTQVFFVSRLLRPQAAGILILKILFAITNCFTFYLATLRLGQ
jgi:hypothetical protein